MDGDEGERRERGHNAPWHRAIVDVDGASVGIARHKALAHLEHLVDAELEQLEELHGLQGVKLGEELVQLRQVFPVELQKREDRLSQVEKLGAEVKQLDKVLALDAGVDVLELRER